MKNTLETRLGIFVALAVIAAVLILETIGGIEKLQSGYPLKALFDSAQDLKEGDRVKMAGVEVGRVEKIGLAESADKVQITFKLRNEVKVRSDSVATIKFTGLMGQSYVSMTFGTPNAPTLKENDYIKTAESPDMSAIMARIDNVAGGVENLTKTFSGDTLNNLMGPLTDFVKANKAPLTATISNIQAVSFQVSQGKGTVGKLIYDESLYNTALATITNLQSTSDEIKQTVADARKAVDQVNSGQGAVGKLLYDNEVAGKVTNVVNNLSEASASLKEILQKANTGQGTVGKILNDPELYKNAKLTLQKLDQATEGLEDQGPLSVLGTVVGRLF